ncbi:MAG: prolyl oligopeptidase family serine peptidase [Phycisphaerales bacterium]|nr:prolyl oligopeptidase family serine peptidase [Phycisphaerales bacterium]
MRPSIQMLNLLLLVFWLNPETKLFGQPTTSRRSTSTLDRAFLAKTLKMPDGQDRKYAIYIPPQYDDDPNHKWPVIISLHGSGECGRDGIKQTRVGLPRYIARNRNKFPFITIMPQAHTLWFRGDDANAVLVILEAVSGEYRIDRDRTYITGFSMGGFATWELTMIRPDIFAAAVPICGVGNKAFVSNIKDLPIWAFHGRLDQNVPVSGSREPIEALRRLGANPSYTEYPTVAHKSWDRAYSSKRLWRWLLKQRRGAPPRTIDYVMPGRVGRVWWLTAQAEGGIKGQARIRAEITEEKRIILQSSGIAAVAVLPNSRLLEAEDTIEVIWNGKLAYKGTFNNGFAIKADHPAQSQPAERP